MDTTTQLPLAMGLRSAALMLILILSLSTPLTTRCIPSHYSLPAIKSMCAEYACSVWSVLSRANRSTEPLLITPRNLFLLVNVIILFLFISLHLQQHEPAARKRSSRRKRQQSAENVLVMIDKKATLGLQASQGALLAYNITGSEAAAAAEKEALCNSVCAAELDTGESFFTEPAVAVQESSMKQLEYEAQEIATVDCSNGELQEGGRLRLVDENKGSDAERSENERLRSIDRPKGLEGEMIAVEDNGRPGSAEPFNGSDEEKIVLDEDGRLRLVDRPQLPSSNKPRKSLSTGDNRLNKVDDPGDNYEGNYDHSLNNDEQHDSLNQHNHNELNNNGTPTIDLSSSPILTPKLNHDRARRASSSSKKTASSRPIRVKKCDSLDATWKAINSGKANRDSNRPHLIRQRSRQDFKPTSSRAGHGLLQRACNDTNSCTSLVRREPSIGQDELNAKVESFIAKFNEQIRIQRQQSLLSYLQMVDRGT